MRPPCTEGWRGSIYYNPADPALWVPKRFGIGWTLNFAHMRAWILLGVLLLIPIIFACAVLLRYAF